MKLVSAKCPNCGAKLEVDSNIETTKCQYCQSAILIDDAINKYKLEISGEVEIKNIPKLDNYLTLAERNYLNKDYSEAYKNYGSVIELDPNNTIALLRYGICKTLANNYIDFHLDYLIQTFEDVIEILKNNNTYDKNIETYINESLIAVNESLSATKTYYYTYVVTQSDLIEIQNKLISIFKFYELVINHTKEHRKYIIQQITSLLKDILIDKSYKSGHDEYGGNVIKTYKLDYNDKIYYSNKLIYYEQILNPENTVTKNIQENISNKSINIKKYMIPINVFLCTLILGSLLSGQFVSSLLLFFIFVITAFKDVSYKLFKDNIKNKRYAIICLIILLLIAIINEI